MAVGLDIKIKATTGCPDCGGLGWKPEHDLPSKHDPENGNCLTCPIQAPCETCQATGAKTVYEYIKMRFVRDTGKTMVWEVLGKAHGSKLGEVKWWPMWRQYCFFPEGRTIYSAGCMAGIQDFVGQLMEDRKK